MKKMIVLALALMTMDNGPHSGSGYNQPAIT